MKQGERRLILAVFLPGTDYPEDVETRLRSRYAVVSALGVSGFIPDDGGDIRCGISSWPAGLPRERKCVVFPYELYSHAKPNPKDFAEENLTRLTHIDSEGASPASIAVVWVDEQLFDSGRVGQDPASVLDQWLRPLDGTKADVAVLGPQLSGTLREMLREPARDKAGSSLAAGDKKIKIYSFSSTVRALRDQPAGKSQVGTEKSRHEQQGPLGGRFEVVHVIGTDPDLAIALRDELLRRGVSLATSQGPIALVGEWDTYYSRSMFDAFATALQPSTSIPASNPVDASGLKYFTYQQGIDGRLPKDRSADTKAQDKSTGGVLPGGEPLVAPPEVLSFGRSQVDYLRRLVDQMKQTGGEKWAAIGLLGSDFYDKILILETLKYEFPDALFFTTDLDERFLDPPAHRTARNLLVASHYGLALHEDLQRAIPPFRSVYQTSLFLGCMKALRDQGTPAPVPWLEHEALARLATPIPIVFEIGLGRAYPLTDPGIGGVHPRAFARVPILGVGLIFKLIALLSAGAIWLLVAWRSLRTLVLSHLWVILAATSVTAAILALAMIDHANPEGEPFTILEGISNWPTVFLRLLAILFCIFAFLRAQSSDTTNLDQLSAQFGLPRVVECAGTFSLSCLVMSDADRDARPVWARYRYLSMPLQRACRVSIQAVIYGCLCLVLLWVLGLPNEPYRGTLNKWTNRAVLAPAVCLAVSLLWFVIDANRLCIRLIHLLDDYEIEWPEMAWKRAAASSGLDLRSLLHLREHPALERALTLSVNRVTSVTILGDRTTAIGPMMYYAAFAYILLFLARSPFFDQYVMSSPLILTYSLALLGVFCCGAWLRYAARRAQRNASERVRAELHALRLAMSTGWHDEAAAKGLETMEQIDLVITKVHTGALSSLGDDPVLHMILIVLGGLGAMLSMEPIRQFLR
jgi:hypothetical protein